MPNKVAPDLAGGIVAGIRSRRADRNRAAGVLECALRDQSGRTSPLLKRWRHGRAVIGPGRVDFEPFLPLGVRVRRPFTTPIVLTVTSVGEVERTNTLGEAWFFQGDVRTIETDLGPIKLGTARDDDVDWAITTLTS